MSEVLEALEGPITPMVCASDDPAIAGALRAQRLLQRQSRCGSRVRDAVVERARLDDARGAGPPRSHRPIPTTRPSNATALGRRAAGQHGAAPYR